MKKINLLLLTVLSILLFSCKDEVALEYDEAAEITASALASNSGGLVAMVESSVSGSTQPGSALRVASIQTVLIDTTFTLPTTTVPGTLNTYSYSWDYTCTLLYSGIVPSTLDVNWSYTGNIAAARFTSDFSGAADLTYSNLVNTTNYTVNTEWTLNGVYTRDGDFESNVWQKRERICHLTVSPVNVIVNKDTRQIVSGTANISLTGTVVGEGDFSYIGVLVFNGNKSGTLTINGHEYTVNLGTGQIDAI